MDSAVESGQPDEFREQVEAAAVDAGVGDIEARGLEAGNSWAKDEASPAEIEKLRQGRVDGLRLSRQPGFLADWRVSWSRFVTQASR